MKKNRFKRLKSTFRKASDYDRMAQSSEFIKTALKRLFVPQHAKRKESFTEAMQRLNITETQVQNKQRAFKRLAMIMLSVALLILGYSFFRIIQGHWHAVIFSLVLMMIVLVLAFRYHFWFFQLKQRKLGCTLEEWFRFTILRRNN